MKPANPRAGENAASRHIAHSSVYRATLVTRTTLTVPLERSNTCADYVINGHSPSLSTVVNATSGIIRGNAGTVRRTDVVGGSSR
jgi:hypothetical protein